MTWRNSALGLLSLLLGLCLALRAQAGVIDAPGEDLEVSPVTYGPGRSRGCVFLPVRAS